MGVTDISARRWNEKPDPADHSPREALAAILRDIDSGEISPDHVIVVYRRDSGTDDEGVGYYQSGKAGWITSIGILERAKYLLMGGE